MNQKSNDDFSKVKNPLDPAFKAAANNRAGQLAQGSKQKAEGSSSPVTATKGPKQAKR